MSSASEEKGITLAAAQWAVRLDGEPLSLSERADLDAWTEADPRHRAALGKARFAWEQLGAFDDDAAVTLLPEYRSAQREVAPLPEPRIRRWWIMPTALAASVALVVVVGTQWTSYPSQRQASTLASVQTIPGQKKLVTLPDGSTALLGPASALSPDYSASQRLVRLDRGVAVFTAAPAQGAEKRPFIVAAGDGTVRALGTRFQVEFEPDGVEVVVIEHAVEVARVAAPKATARVQAGEMVRYGDAGVGPVRRTDVALATAWQQGQLVFNERPLGEVLTRLNRYRQDRLVLAAGLDGRRVSGVFETGKPDVALQLLKDQFGLRERAIAPGTIELY